MLTVDSVNKATRRYWVAVYASLVPLIALLGLSGGIAHWLADLLYTVGFKIRWQTLLLGVMAFFVVLTLWVIFMIQRWTLPTCPTCGKRITPNLNGIVIATKNCPNCGSVLIAQGS